MPNPNKDLGPCSVLWDARTGGVNLQLNPTFGGVTFRDEVLHVEVKEDQQGETPVDHVHTGRIVEITVPMTRSTLTQLEAAIAGSVDDVAAGNLKVSNKVGQSCFVNARQLVLKPVEDGVATAESTWLYVHRCYPFSNLEWMYDNAGQRVTNVVFKAYPDDNSPWVNEMWRFGPCPEAERV